MCKYCEKVKIGTEDVFVGYSNRHLPKYKKVDVIGTTSLEATSEVDDFSTMHIDVDKSELIMHHKGNAYSYTFDVNLSINYCPICGRKLK